MNFPDLMRVSLTAPCGLPYSVLVDSTCRDRLRAFCLELESDSAIAAVYLFGSHARDSATAVSDVDLAILIQPTIDESRHFALRLDCLSRAMDRLRTERVDVVILNRAPLHLAYEIVSRAILLLDRNRAYRAGFEADRIGRFLDFKPFLAVQTRAIREQLKGGTFFD